MALFGVLDYGSLTRFSRPVFRRIRADSRYVLRKRNGGTKLFCWHRAPKLTARKRGKAGKRTAPAPELSRATDAAKTEG